MTRLLAAFWLLLALALATPAAAQKFPENNGSPVVDQAGILTPAQVADLRSKSQALYAQSGRAFAIATVKSLEGYEISDYSYRLLRYWKLGSAKNDDGVLLVVAPNERKVWITTGYGAGAFLTDAMAGIITREAILPRFKQNPPDYGGGIQAGADAIIKQMSLPVDQAQKNIAVAEKSQQAWKRSGGGGVPVAFVIMIVAFIVLSRLRRVGGRRYYPRRGRSGISPWIVLWGLNELSRGSRGGWSGGNSWGGGGSSWGGGGGFGGGGFGGFGGGSGGGGGAGGSW